MNYFVTPEISEKAFTVSSLNSEIQQLLEASLPWILVEGEISNLARPSSGHWYFSLKDSKAQIRCAMFKSKSIRVRFTPKDGDLVRLRAKVTLYGPRGDCQLTVESMELGGEGALQQSYERLKNQLQSEGLFDATHKKSLPTLPEKVAIITSPVGAAVRDMITTFKRRFPLTELIVIPSLVQGQGAAKNLTEQLLRIDASGHFDAIIIGRGGGSLEDLYSFNDENLARTIFHANTPIISAVGHETDFTIADFVADVRAATPTAAAELLSPDRQQLLQTIQQKETYLAHVFTRQLQQQQQKVDFLTQRIRHPCERISAQQDKLDILNKRLEQGILRQTEQQRTALLVTQQNLRRADPTNLIEKYQQAILQSDSKLQTALLDTLDKKRIHFANLVDKLNLVSPLNILSRGYAIASHEGHVVKSIKQVKKGDYINVKVKDGELACQIKNTNG
ncbi:exodeoxyribonuclease VII large subunit [Marinomonas agarivorans]|nr:exodeoxyribonuclease VII large subunit [Marinomonas agarivorans]